MRSKVWIVAVTLVAATACGGNNNGTPIDAGVDAPVDAGPVMEHKDIPLMINRNVDVLFVIDDSPSTADKQRNLVNNFPRFLATLSTVQGGLPNLHLGVVTTDLGTSGASGTPGPGIGVLGAGGCAGTGKNGVLQLFGAPVTGVNFLSDVLQANGTRARNYTGDLAAAFATMASAGSGGCGFEQPLEAIKRALAPSTQANAGFLRLDAYLAVVVLTDEDDCSLATPALLDPGNAGGLGPLESFRCTRFGVTCQGGGATPDQMNQAGAKTQCAPTADRTYLTAPADYAAFLHALKDDPRKVMVAALMGPPEPVSVELRAASTGQPKIPALAHACTYTAADGVEVADPAVRLRALLDQFPDRSDFESVCAEDLTGPLARIAGLIRSVIGDPCIEGRIADGDLTTPGVQPSCQVSVQSGAITTPLAACDATATNRPCWHLVEDAQACAFTPTFLRLQVEGQDQLAADAHLLASCLIDP
ncbi:MAG TPA: hypothetical protein VFP84_17740 [Kofleriaceae bacterium]|nr:hypothetical protein [Kofleriaceae bacterium]